MSLRADVEHQINNNYMIITIFIHLHVYISPTTEINLLRPADFADDKQPHHELYLIYNDTRTSTHQLN